VTGDWGDRTLHGLVISGIDPTLVISGNVVIVIGSVNVTVCGVWVGDCPETGSAAGGGAGWSAAARDRVVLLSTLATRTRVSRRELSRRSLRAWGRERREPRAAGLGMRKNGGRVECRMPSSSG
jgi:hypothetical protein